jgi:hypothetical protein
MLRIANPGAEHENRSRLGWVEDPKFIKNLPRKAAPKWETTGGDGEIPRPVTKRAGLPKDPNPPRALDDTGARAKYEVLLTRRCSRTLAMPLIESLNSSEKTAERRMLMWSNGFGINNIFSLTMMMKL